MPTSVSLPALGESVTEGTVTRWLKQVGDTVAVDEPLLEVSTDKVDTEIPSPVAGTLLEIKAAEDETVEVGAELAVIGDAGESSGSVRPRQKPPQEAPPPRPRPPPRRPRLEAPAAQAAPAQQAPAAAGSGRSPRPPPRSTTPRSGRRGLSRRGLLGRTRVPRSPCPPWVRASPRAPSPAG